MNELSHKSQTTATSRCTHFPEGGSFTPDSELLARLEELIEAKLDFRISQTCSQKKRSRSQLETIERTENARKFRLRYPLQIVWIGFCNRPSIQTPFCCTRSKCHIPRRKRCAPTDVSYSITAFLLHLEFSRVWEPPLEDSGHEAELRKQQALSAAVDVPSLVKSAQGYTVESLLSFCMWWTPTH